MLKVGDHVFRSDIPVAYCVLYSACYSYILIRTWFYHYISAVCTGTQITLSRTCVVVLYCVKAFRHERHNFNTAT